MAPPYGARKPIDVFELFGWHLLISNGNCRKRRRLRGVLLSLMSFIAASKYERDAHVAFYRYCWLPNVGKSSLFTALTKKTGFAANYPFATIEPNTGMVPVP